MSRKVKYRYVCDSLELCFKKPDGLFEKLSQYHTGEYVPLADLTKGGYKDKNIFLLIISDGRGKDEKADTRPRSCLQARLVVQSRVLGDCVIGDFDFKHTSSNPYVHFKFENEALYNDLVVVGNEPSAPFPVFEHVKTSLGLEYNNVTQCDIALDVQNMPIITTIRKLFKTDITTIINGKSIEDRGARLKGYKEIFSRNLLRLDRLPTINVKNAEETLSIRIYDKTKEIEEASGKTYCISNFFNPKKPVYRMEISVKNKMFKRFVKSSETDQFGDYKIGDAGIFKCHDFLEALLSYGVNKLLRFTTKDRKHIGIDEIAKGLVNPLTRGAGSAELGGLAA